jgi:hypothetical protein
MCPLINRVCVFMYICDLFHIHLSRYKCWICEMCVCVCNVIVSVSCVVCSYVGIEPVGCVGYSYIGIEPVSCYAIVTLVMDVWIMKKLHTVTWNML